MSSWIDNKIESESYSRRPRRNLILSTDSYKASHPFQYPNDLTHLYAYVCSRGGGMDAMFFGLQAFLIDKLLEPITSTDVAEAAMFFEMHGEPFPYAGWMRVVEKHQGRLPLHIRALPEGTIAPKGVPMLTVENTDPELPWLVSWLETAILRGVWYPTTVASKSLACKREIWAALQRTADAPAAELPFKLHDFGARGVSSEESAAIGGMAHLVNFQGSDTVEGVRYANHFYAQTDVDKPVMSAFSIPAAEHSTMVLEGPGDGEINRMRHFLHAFTGGKQAGRFPVIACVSDGFNIFNAVENIWCGELLPEVLASGAKLVVRPDSGDPVDVNLKLLDIFKTKGQMHINSKGFLVLKDHFGLIQGDGNNDANDIRRILEALEYNGYSASNLAFGMGGGLLQQVNRDTLRFKYMVSEARYAEGRTVAIQKNPITDKRKTSAAGRVDAIENAGRLMIYDNQIGLESALRSVYLDGKLLRRESLAEIRARAGREFT